ncbi:YggS family pyridoxal phosphate-dependent enzyme [Pseudarthrobacter sp. J75]|uniref:YggS family pyridoxal phosphate-dependent enzyme n=1 Tax=unclassified Pseudarthrobacter TaxID=2647000 RepID=UPI002E8042F3|nr:MULTISPECIES: YggS family pyridoxal phosphate-dependent enzyme [unclassified Pseudarthrobacter]MEE2522758.1 YggS family pyridoxal phosphate-dependent enzyme [Pseudarthrobacter sp. J47]MEE2529619.1 YggS family pyridoxal phosphate-dependent enzyme [Pseudarthrobacter sp. J75]
MAEQQTDAARRDQLERNLSAVQHRIAAAAALRDAPPPTLIVVTKFHPASDVRILSTLGISDFGENRDQEAAAKAADVAGFAETAAAPPRWHFIGQLQSNKAKSVVKYAHSVHSVDRLQLADALDKAMAAESGRTGRAPLECFIQVNLDERATASSGQSGAGQRGGASPADVPELADRIASSGLLRLAGLMAVAPLGVPAEGAFEKLAGISARLQADHPGASGVSAGMSQDLEAAIRFGATHLRIGSDILGSRPAVG